MIKKYQTIIVVTLALVAFSAFGCKNADTQTESDNTNTTPTQDVSFAPPEPTGTATDNKTQDVVFPTNGGTNTTNTANTTNTPTDTANVAPPTEPTTPTLTEEETVIKLSKTLSEIYGTYTNKDKESYSNYKSMLPYATEKVKTWLNGEIAKSKTSDLSSPFYGITTRAVSAGILESSTTAYTVLVTVEREEINETSNKPNKFYQLIKIDLVKEGEDWKLNGTYWQ